ncbi:MAG: hypothetical protein Q4B50_01675 [Bacillota bacterium]|nr:hypothetical protein [Bacillota bacterium]
MQAILPPQHVGIVARERSEKADAAAGEAEISKYKDSLYHFATCDEGRGKAACIDWLWAHSDKYKPGQMVYLIKKTYTAMIEDFHPSR